MIDVNDFLNRAADKNGFTRDRYEAKRIPTDVSNIIAMPFFGDVRSSFVLSSLLLKRYREEMKGSKYFVLCSWHGHQGLYPYVDEYWSVRDEAFSKRLYEATNGFVNKSDLYTLYMQGLNEFFRDVVDYRDLEPFYSQGITDEFWKQFRHVKRTLPLVPSGVVVSKEFNKQLMTKAGFKVFVWPSFFSQSWQLGRTKHIRIEKDFWVALVNRLTREGFVPVLWNSPLSYNLSDEFPDQCIYVVERDISKVLSAMRATGCVLDVFNQISRLAIASRCPYLALDERKRYTEMKEYEIDDLCANSLPKRYIFSFATIIGIGNARAWNMEVFDNIVRKLKDFMPELNRDDWPSTGESTEIVAYDHVRQRKVHKMGARLLKVTRD